MDRTPPEPNPMLILGSLVDAFENGWIKSQSQACFKSLDEVEGQIGMGPDDLPDDLLDDETAQSEDTSPLYSKETPGERPGHSYLCRRLDGSDEGKKG